MYHPSNSSPRLLFIELNEFNPDYLSSAAKTFGLANISRALSFPRSTTTTADEINHHGLDPWVQWAAIHCGKPTADHGIRRLGATSIQGPQLWHAIANEGFTWGVWGAMNAPMGNPANGKFFMPDPWSFEERAFPEQLNDFLALPRYAATNYMALDYRKVFASALRLARFFAPPKHWTLLARFGSVSLKAVVSTQPSVHMFATLLDYLSVLVFLRLRLVHRPNLSIIFLNHIAHLQHQFWLNTDIIHPEMKLGLKLCDAMLGLLLDHRAPSEGLILMNGLRQINIADQGSFIYCPHNPQSAIEMLGVIGGRVEQRMTNDAIIIFAVVEDADRATDLLQRAHFSDGRKVFYVERHDPWRVFYQLAFDDEIDPKMMIISGNDSYPFHDIFQPVAEHTGKHVPDGDVFYDGIAIPKHIANHEIYDHILGHFRRLAART